MSSIVFYCPTKFFSPSTAPLTMKSLKQEQKSFNDNCVGTFCSAKTHKSYFHLPLIFKTAILISVLETFPFKRN